MAPLGVAVLGLGTWGTKLARSLHHLEGCRLLALCDCNAGRLTHYPDIPRATELKTLLANPQIDAVVIATPADTHFEIALAALRSGKHVFVEKPLACRSDHAEQLLRESEKLGLVLMVDHTYLFAPALGAIRTSLSKGQLGPLHYFESQRLNENCTRQDTSVLWDLAWHDIAILDHLFCVDAWQVSAERIGEHAMRLELSAPSAPPARIEVNWTAGFKRRRIEIGGSEGVLLYDDLEAPHRKVQITTAGRTSHPPLSEAEPLTVALRHFVQCVTSGTTPISDGAAGLRIARVLETAELSFRAVGAHA